MTLFLDNYLIEAAVFDFDGVLADTARGWAVAEAALCANYDIDYTDDLAAGTHGVGLDDAVQHLTTGRDSSVAPSEAGELMRSLAAEHVPAHLEPIAGAIEVVSAFARRVPVAIASNTERSLLEPLVRALGLAETVHSVVAATDVPAPKPAPDIYQEAARRLGARPGRTLAVEDSPTGGNAARASGCIVLALLLDGAPAVPNLSWAALRAGSHADLLARIRPASPTSAHLPEKDSDL